MEWKPVDETYIGPEYGDFKVWGKSGGASEYGVGGMAYISSEDSKGRKWTRSFVAVGEWRLSPEISEPPKAEGE